MQAFQKNGATQLLRYKFITIPLSRWIGARVGAKVLSFGCSDGDEVLPFALNAPDANILGVDIDEAAVGRARQRYTATANATFEVSSWPAIEDAGPFDLVMANAVLCHHPDAKKLDDLSAHFPFQQFAETVERLTGLLKPDGVFMVMNTNYLMADLDIADRLYPIDTPALPFNGIVPKFDRGGRKIIEIGGGYSIEVRDGETRDPADMLRHSLYGRSLRSARDMAGLFRTPHYEEVRCVWRETIAPRQRPGWHAVPIEKTLSLVKTDEGDRILQRWFRVAPSTVEIGANFMD